MTDESVDLIEAIELLQETRRAVKADRMVVRFDVPPGAIWLALDDDGHTFMPGPLPRSVAT